MKISRLAPSPCPNCGKTLDSATSAQPPFDHKPSPGDLTICLDCHTLLAFADDLTLRLPNDAEMKDAAGDPALVRAMAAIASYRRAHPKP